MACCGQRRQQISRTTPIQRPNNPAPPANVNRAAVLSRTIGGLVTPLVAAVFYQIGSGLDPVFDLIFQPATDNIPIINMLGRGMRRARREAANHLKTGELGPLFDPDATKGIYRKAMVLYGDTKLWKNDPEPKLHISKAARNLIFPITLVLGYHLWKQKLLQPMSSAEWLSKLDFFSVLLALTVIGLFIICVCLRVLHMKALYRLVLGPR